MKKLLLILLLGMFMFSFVSASTETYPVNQEVNLILTCTINNAIPSSLATMNLTIAYPNGTLLVDNQPATAKGSGIFNYTTTFPIIGTYHPTLICIDGSDSFSDSSDRYIITSTGEITDGNQGYMIIGVMGIIGLLLIIGFSFDKTKWKLRTAFFMFALLFGIILLNSIRIIAEGSSSLNQMGDVGLILGIVILSFMFLFMLINYTIELFRYFKRKNINKFEVEEQV